jgi:integrase
MRLVWFRGKWHAYERVDGQPKRTSLGTADRQVAERRLIDLKQTKRRKPATAAEMHAVYLEERGPRLASQETLRFAWKRLSPVFGHLRPDQITRALTRAYAARERRRKISDGSIRRDLGVLSAILRYNNKSSPAVIDLPPAPPPRSRHLTREQYRALRDAAAKTPHLHLFVILAYTTAGRSSAILELTWNRVDYARGEIRLGLGERRSKGRATVPMVESARDVLDSAHRAALTDYVIEYAGGPVRSVKRAFARAAERAGIPWCTPHVLRHTAAVHMAESGVPMAEISQYLGHSSTGVTERVYARYSPQYLRRAASALE